MDFKIDREMISAGEVVFDGVQEQSVELDSILPDYFPDIFSILKCRLIPRIVSHSVSGGRLSYELSVAVRVLYNSENSGAVRCFERCMSFSKSVDIGRAVDSCEAIIRPSEDYVNCRAVNRRRIDLHGAVSCRIKVVCNTKQYAVSDAYGMNIQVKRQPVGIVAEKLFSESRMSVSEELDLGDSKPPILSIIRSSAEAVITDKKIIANKLVTKGEAAVNMLYSCVKESEDSLEAMQFTLPFSRIVDMDGVDERFECAASVEIASLELTPKGGADGDSRRVSCELGIVISCTAVRSVTAELATDAFSTEYGVSCEYLDIRAESAPKQINESFMAKASVPLHGREIRCILDVSAETANLSTGMDADGRIVVSGTLKVSLLAKDSENTPFCLDSEAPFEYTVPCSAAGGVHADFTAHVHNCSYSMAADGSVEVSADIRISGRVCECSACRLIGDIAINEEEKKQPDGDYALKLYFAGGDESVWDIAKRYGVSMQGIMEENELEGDIVGEGRMLLIPIMR